MELGRRGFMGLLAGLVLAPKVIGPKQLTAPTPEAWRAVRDLRQFPPESSYVSLEVFANEALRIVHEEIKWLRLHHDTTDKWAHWHANHLGYTVAVREPVRFIPQQLDEPYNPFRPLLEKSRLVTLKEHASAVIPMDDFDVRRLWDKVSRIYVEPAAMNLARQITDLVRINGGADCMVSMAPAIPDAVQRGVAATSEDFGLSLRALQLGARASDGRPAVHLDMLFGLG